MSKTAQPKIAELREFYSQAVAYSPEEQLAAQRNIIRWYDTKAAFTPMPVDKRFDKLRELAVNNPATQEALTAAGRVIPIYEKHMLAGVKNPPSLDAVQTEITARQAELKTKWEAQQAEEKKLIHPLLAALNKCFVPRGVSFTVARVDRQRDYANGVITLGFKYAKKLAAMPTTQAAVHVLDFVARALCYDSSVGKISSAKYVTLMPDLLAGVDGLFSALPGDITVSSNGAFTYLKRVRSDKAKLVGDRYRPYTYQAIVWQRLYEAKGGWVTKAELTAGLDTPWPHRIPIHLQKEGERGRRWNVDIEKNRVRMTGITVPTNFPEET